MTNIDLEQEEKRLDKEKNKLKKKAPLLYLLILLLSSLATFYFGNFLNNSHFVKFTNPFIKLFGQTIVEITPYYNPEISENYTKIYFEIKNVGDKDIQNLYLLYSFCGFKQEKADLGKMKLNMGESGKFSIMVPFKLNLSCSVFTDRVKADVYEDINKNCYLDIEKKVTNICKYCKVEFQVYENNQILNYSYWYPYLDEPTDVGSMTRFLLVNHPLSLTWKEGYTSKCKVLIPSSSKNALNKKETIYTSMIDTGTMCLRGEDVEWCKDNFYTKSRIP